MPYQGLLSVVIPVYGSERYLRKFVKELTSFLTHHGNFEILLVNDGSPDNVQREIDAIVEGEPRVRAIELAVNHGQHQATLYGCAQARGDIAVTVDDDGQNPPSAILEVVTALQTRGDDVVYGRFHSPQQTFLRRAMSRLNRWLTKIAIGNTSGVVITNVRAMRGDLARHIGAQNGPFVYIDALIFRSTRHISETLVEHCPRIEGRSSYSLFRLLKLWVSHMTVVSGVPLRFATYVSFGVAGSGFLLGCFQIVRALTLGRAPTGWLSLFSVTTFLFSVLFGFLGVLSTYVARMYIASNTRDLMWERRTKAQQQLRERRKMMP